MENYNDIRYKIRELDSQIERETDTNRKLDLIDENIKLRKKYYELLDGPITGYIVGCVLLSIFFFGLGLACFLPPIIVRNAKKNGCLERIKELENLKKTL